MNKTKFYEKQDKLRTDFLGFRDPLGVAFANKHLGGYPELERILKFSWFEAEWENWQRELRALIKSEALKRIMEILEEGGPQSLVAAKYLANGEYLDEVKTKRGRPTNAEVNGLLKEAAKRESMIQKDYERMHGLQVIEGGRAN